MEIHVTVFNRICRVCLKESTNMKSLFAKVDGEERKLYDVLAFIANIRVNYEDALPKQVCNECESNMCKADAFKRRCLESDTILNNLWLSSGSVVGLPNLVNTKHIKHEASDNKQNVPVLVECQPSNSYIQDMRDTKNNLFNAITISIPPYGSEVCEEYNVSDNKELAVKKEVLNNIDMHIDNSDDYQDISYNETVAECHEETVKADGATHTCFCGLIFTSEEKYKTHTNLKKCNKYKKFVEKLSNEKIIKIIPLRNRLKCVHCHCDFSTPNAWQVHQNKYHSKNIKNNILDQSKNIENNIADCYQNTPKKIIDMFHCAFCIRIFKSKSSLSKHIRTHEESNHIKHTCVICKREFKYKAHLDNHILSAHSRNDGLTCDVCAKGFTSSESLEIHKESHKNKNHHCTICGKSFVMSCTLKEHMRTHTGEKPFLCSECGRSFSQKNNLTQHIRRHQGLKPFKCENCEKRFISKGELDAHNRKHSGAHPFVCDQCGNGFTTSSALVKHKRIHTGERPYLCDLCPMRFAASGTLKNHRRTHTGERPFQCSHCEKAFVQRNDLISHIRCHTGERPYVCTQCGQSFRKASGLKVHVKMHGKELQSVLQGMQ